MAAFKSSQSSVIMMPSDVVLSPQEHGMLTWSVKYQSWQDDLVEKPIKGCLQEFIKLAKVPVERRAIEVETFAQKFGVLGIFPLVEEKGPFDPASPMYQSDAWAIYKEPVVFYAWLAHYADTVITLMRRVHRRKPIPKIAPHPQVAYVTLLEMASRWVFASSSKIILLPGVGSFSAQEGIYFGAWEEGKWWEMLYGQESARLYEAVSEFERLLPLKRERGWQRPSPLFNVLATQLMAEVALEEGSVFCDWCGNVLEPEEGRRLRPDRKNYHLGDCQTRGDAERVRKWKMENRNN